MRLGQVCRYPAEGSILAESVNIEMAFQIANEMKLSGSGAGIITAKAGLGSQATRRGAVGGLAKRNPPPEIIHLALSESRERAACISFAAWWVTPSANPPYEIVSL
jgi:hypothetical protein